MPQTDDAVTNAYQEHRRLLFAIAYRVTSSREAAEDAVQETFISLMRREQDGGAAQDIKAWLTAVVYRRAMDQLRKRYRRKRREMPHGLTGHAQEEPELWLPCVSPDDVEREVIEQDAADHLHDLIRTVQPVKRFDGATLLQMVADGYKGWEIANRMGVKDGTVESRLVYLRRAVKAELQRQGIG